MSQAKINTNGDLCIIFKEVEDDVFTSFHLDNGAEFNFVEDELVELVLPRFDAQLNRGSLLGLSIELVDIHFDNEKLKLSIKIMDEIINITLDCSSIIDKV